MNKLELPAASGKAKSLMVLLHGLGSNGDDLFSLAPFFSSSLKDTYFFSPDGIEKCDMVPFGYQWFSLQDRSEKATLSELERVSSTIDSMIENKKNQLALRDEDVILCGFSQGAMVSLYLALSTPKKYSAVVSFSGAFIQPREINNTTTPICLIHGTDDEVVPFSCMHLAQNRLQDLGVTVETLEVPNLAHSIDISGIETASAFIKKRVK